MGVMIPDVVQRPSRNGVKSDVLITTIPRRLRTAEFRRARPAEIREAYDPQEYEPSVAGPTTGDVRRIHNFHELSPSGKRDDFRACDVYLVMRLS